MPNNQNPLLPIANLFRSIWRSCYDISFYRGVRRAPLAKAIFYFLTLHAVIALSLFLALIPAALKVRTGIENFVNKEVPANASILLRNGRMTTMNLPHPWAPDGFKGLLIVDSEATGPATAPGSLVFGGTKLFTRNDSGVSETEYGKNDTIRLDQKNILRWLQSSASRPVAVAAAFAFASAFLLFELIVIGVFVGLVSGLMLLFSRAFKLEIPYRQWYAVGLHAVTLPQLVSVIFTALFAGMPILWFGLFFLVAFSVLKDERLSPLKNDE